jgi:conserved hypothetical integral membrane protein
MNTENTEILAFGKWLFAAVFVASLVTANVTASKLAIFDFPILGEVTGSVAAVMIAVSFLMTDLCSEIYGKQVTRYIVNASIVAVGVSFGLIAVALTIPASDAYQNTAAFQTIFTASYPILIASILSLLVSQNLDVSIFHTIRSKTGYRHKWIRNILSTGISQLLDTAVFTVLAFAVLPVLFSQSGLPMEIILGIIIAEYLIKLVFAFGDTVVFYLLTGIAEKVDASPAGTGD